MKQEQEAVKVLCSANSLLTELKSCTIRKDLQWGIRIHVKAEESGNVSNVYVLTALIKMYAKCGSMVDARKLFNNIKNPDVVSWNVLLLGYAENGDGRAALDLFSGLKARGIRPTSVTYIAALKACTSLAVNKNGNDALERGKTIHTEIGFPSEQYVQNTLIDMYVKCGSVVEAQRVFDSVSNPDVVAYNVLLMGYADNGEGSVGLDLFSKMKVRGCAQNSATYVAVLKACTSLAVRGDRTMCLERGREVHSEIGSHMNSYVYNTLIDMYSKCGSMSEARKVFDSVKKPDFVSWTALLLGYAENGEGLTALEVFSRMKAAGCEPNSVTYVAALKACTALAANADDGISKEDCLNRGRGIHLEVGRYMNQYVQSTLIEMYSKCGSMVDARGVFDTIRNPDVVSWSALLLGYAENKEGHVALEMFSKMKESGCSPNHVTYVAALQACTSLAASEGRSVCLGRGKEIHLEIGFTSDRYVQNTLIDMYAKCGCMVEARRVFESMKEPNVVSWTALMLGYVENCEGKAALELFSRMKTQACAPDSITYVAALKACTSLASNSEGSGKAEFLEQGRCIHMEIGPNLDRYVQSALIDMYANCGSMGDAHSVFDSIQKPDVASWTALLLGYAVDKQGPVALNLYDRMRESGCKPSPVTYVAALKACTSLALNEDENGRLECLRRGREIHSEVSCLSDTFIHNTLIDMYAKCGCMQDARRVFDAIPKPNVVSWTVLLMGYADNGEGLAALQLFSRMKALEYTPDSVTYVAALKACTSLVGSANGKADCLDRGREIHREIGFHSSHFLQSTLIDMYTKGGSMSEARDVFESIQNPDVVAWNTLLLGYADSGKGIVVLDLFSRMKASGCAPNAITYVAALKACVLSGSLTLGRKFHYEISEFTAHLVTCLVDFYAKCGSIHEARDVFDTHRRERGVSTWNALLAGYGSYGDSASVFSLFEAMKDEGFRPDAVTFVCMLLCCSHAGLVAKAKGYFEAMATLGITPSVLHYTCMVDVLGRANQLNEALALLRGMPCSADAVTWTTLLGACRKWKNVEIGRIAFQFLVGLDKKDASAHVLMAQIYGSRGMFEEQKIVLETSLMLPSHATMEQYPSEFEDQLQDIGPCIDIRSIVAW